MHLTRKASAPYGTSHKARRFINFCAGFTAGTLDTTQLRPTSTTGYTVTFVAVTRPTHMLLRLPSCCPLLGNLPPWSGGKHPPTGVIDPKHAPCTNGSSVCNSGQSTFWFSQGCTIGCPHCTGNGSRIANFDHCPSASIKPTLLAKYRTANRNSKPGSTQDVFKYNPWRAPGLAPVWDSCGMAGGAPTPTTASHRHLLSFMSKQCVEPIQCTHPTTNIFRQTMY